MRQILSSIVFLLLFTGMAAAADLYQVLVENENDAEILRRSGATAIVRTDGGYLVLADKTVGMIDLGFKAVRIAENVRVEDLAVDISHNTAALGRFPVLYQEDELQLIQAKGGVIRHTLDEAQLSPVPLSGLSIEYRPPMQYNFRATAGPAGLDSLIDLVSTDSLVSYSERLQAFNGRVVGSDSCLAATDWIMEKFMSFGYDSVVFDTFRFNSHYGSYEGRNVVCTKPGSRYPEWTIVVGAHHDAVPGSPGADDNGSGTVGVLEIARILSQIETDVTIKFVTFDGEEYGLHGSWHMADKAVAEGEPIIYMLNMDMIAHYTNDNDVKLFTGAETSYSQLFSDLADSLIGLNAILYGSSGGSDHYPFQQNGFAVTFVHEYIFSSVYHSPRDSTTYMNFDYMTRNVQASLATTYAANLLPPHGLITSVIDSGSGEALQVNWVAMDPSHIDYFHLFYYPTEDPGALDSIVIDGALAGYTVTGLTEGVEYTFYLLPYDFEGRTAVEYHEAYGVPQSIPSNLQGLTAVTKVAAIELSWNNNPELDISHYRIVRDDELLPFVASDTAYIDDDPALGAALHRYQVYAVDIDGLMSDTAGLAGVISRAATLDQHRILAINRSTDQVPYLVNEMMTGEFIHEALAGFNYDYYSDTAYLDDDIADRLEFFDLLDYEMVVIGGESAIQDDFGGATGILGILGQYMALGGKVIIFGRWGWLDFETTLIYDSGSVNYGYNTFFDTPSRTLTLTTSSGTELVSDMIGVVGQTAGYPDLVWDSTAAVSHSVPYTDVSGIPCVSYPILGSGEQEVLYRYNSTDNCCAAEGRAIAWRSGDPDREYVFFEIPLSFMERTASVAALSRAVVDFGFPVASTLADPDMIDVMAEAGETVDLILGNLTGGRNASEINGSTITINESLAPLAVEVIPFHPDFDGEVCRVTVSSAVMAAFYEPVIDTVLDNYTITWQFDGSSIKHTVQGEVNILGHTIGDANGDNAINVGDAVHLINYVFKSGPPPYPLETGDANCDGAVNVGDAVAVINFVFKGGLVPGCP